MFLQGLGKDAFEGLVVLVLLEQSMPRHRAIEHVVDQTARSIAGCARHVGMVGDGNEEVNAKRVASPFSAQSLPLA
jgi:hypothetical protein